MGMVCWVKGRYQENVTHIRAFIVKKAIYSQMLTCVQTAICNQEHGNTEFPPRLVLLFPVRFLSESHVSDKPLLAISCILSLIFSTCKYIYFFLGAAGMSRMIFVHQELILQSKILSNQFKCYFNSEGLVSTIVSVALLCSFKNVSLTFS